SACRGQIANHGAGPPRHSGPPPHRRGTGPAGHPAKHKARDAERPHRHAKRCRTRHAERWRPPERPEAAHRHHPLIRRSPMGIQTSPRIRGAVRVRAETGDANAILADLNRAFAAFKDEHQAEISSINARFADVVQTEKVERINAEITRLQGALDETNATLAAARLGGG